MRPHDNNKQHRAAVSKLRVSPYEYSRLALAILEENNATPPGTTIDGTTFKEAWTTYLGLMRPVCTNTRSNSSPIATITRNKSIYTYIFCTYLWYNFEYILKLLIYFFSFLIPDPSWSLQYDVTNVLTRIRTRLPHHLDKQILKYQNNYIQWHLIQYDPNK